MATIRPTKYMMWSMMSRMLFGKDKMQGIPTSANMTGVTDAFLTTTPGPVDGPVAISSLAAVTFDGSEVKLTNLSFDDSLQEATAEFTIALRWEYGMQTSYGGICIRSGGHTQPASRTIWWAPVSGSFNAVNAVEFISLNFRVKLRYVGTSC